MLQLRCWVIRNVPLSNSNSSSNSYQCKEVCSLFYTSSSWCCTVISYTRQHQLGPSTYALIAIRSILNPPSQQTRSTSFINGPVTRHPTVVYWLQFISSSYFQCPGDACPWSQIISPLEFSFVQDCKPIKVPESLRLPRMIATHAINTHSVLFATRVRDINRPGHRCIRHLNATVTASISIHLLEAWYVRLCSGLTRLYCSHSLRNPFWFLGPRDRRRGEWGTINGWELIYFLSAISTTACILCQKDDDNASVLANIKILSFYVYNMHACLWLRECYHNRNPDLSLR